MEHILLISDAAKEVQVESHVLRYWEEELHLPIHRNELGHRYYTEEDVERFKQIKGMKERGLQLKAIKMILKDGKIDVMLPEEEKATLKQKEGQEKQEGAGKQEGTGKQEEPVNPSLPAGLSAAWGQQGLADSKEEKARRLQWLMQQMIQETLQENNKRLCRELRESIVKELDYQFRAQEEREEERDKVREEREEQHYQKLDELLRAKSRKLRASREDPLGTARAERKLNRRKEAERKRELKEKERQEAALGREQKRKERKEAKKKGSDGEETLSDWEEKG